jgi:hypothetical protein
MKKMTQIKILKGYKFYNNQFSNKISFNKVFLIVKKKKLQKIIKKNN